MSAAERPSYAGLPSALGIEKGEDLGRRATARVTHSTGPLAFAIVAMLVDGGDVPPGIGRTEEGRTPCCMSSATVRGVPYSDAVF